MWGSSRYSILLCSFNARFRILFASKRFSNTGKGTIIRREKALKSQLLKGIRVNKKYCLISRRNSISVQIQNINESI